MEFFDSDSGLVKIVFLGTGDAFNTNGRLFTSVLVVSSFFRILLDCGPHVIYALERLGYPINSVTHVLVTHLHGDHAAGLPFLQLNITHRDRGEITVVGPSGIEVFIKETYSRFFKMSDEAPFKFGQPSDGDLPFNLHHIEGSHPVVAYIYRLEVDGRSIVYTGDTAKVDLSKFARGADLLIHEASSLSPRAGEFGHSTPFEAAETAASSKVGQLALVHAPDFPLDTEKSVKSIFPETLFPKDFDSIEI